MSYQDEKVPSMLLYACYQIPFEQADTLIDNWLRENPQKSSLNLYNLISKGKIIVKNGFLYEIPPLSLKEAQSLALELQADNGVEIKNRWYNLKLYRQCFIGSELVDWLTKTKGITTEEAIALGQNLFEYQLIKHVHEDHDFKNEFLFYRFC
ncbi:DEP domain-containing protein [Pleurocapsa sp. PCC 7319]|uniref:DEP domain-containing protein n=1 Tax=Pleurocapsa sp. PCC 7319 TaxID=118161 RepID=UPI00034D22EA|nr:DEP domain-containing protein [Pleurocapsa sp. PCC 7319]